MVKGDARINMLRSKNLALSLSLRIITMDANCYHKGVNARKWVVSHEPSWQYWSSGQTVEEQQSILSICPCERTHATPTALRRQQLANVTLPVRVSQPRPAEIPRRTVSTERQTRLACSWSVGTGELELQNWLFSFFHKKSVLVFDPFHWNGIIISINNLK